MLRRKKYYVIYPEYLDIELSRKEGRKVPKKLAAEKPSLKKLIYATKKLGLKYQIEEDKAYPTRWWEENGRLLIEIDKENKIPKYELLKKIADIVRRLVPKKKVLKKGRRDKNSKTPPVR